MKAGVQGLFDYTPFWEPGSRYHFTINPTDFLNVWSVLNKWSLNSENTFKYDMVASQNEVKPTRSQLVLLWLLIIIIIIIILADTASIVLD